MVRDKYRHEWERQGWQSAEEHAVMGVAVAVVELEAKDEAGRTAEIVEADSSAETAGDERNSVAQVEIETLNDCLKRTLAELENLRKRSECEKAQMSDLGVKSVLERSLLVTNNFECGIAQVLEGEDDGIRAYAEGMDMICRQLSKNLRGAGIKAIDVEDKSFDPVYRNTVMHEDNEAFGENVVSEELQKDYLCKDSVFRHSMVKVVN